MKTNQSIALAGAVLTLNFLLTACSTPTAYTLASQSDDPNDFYKDGLRYHVQKVDQAKVSLAFDTMKTQSEAQFDVKITNLGTTKFDFDASMMSCDLSVKSNPGIREPGQIENPEDKITSLQASYEALNPTGWDSLVRTLNTIDQLENLGPGKGNRRREREAQERQAQLDLQDLTRTQEQKDIVREIRFWRRNTLRRTTLKKGKSVHGSVICAFTRNDSYDQVSVTVGINGKSTEFGFNRYPAGGGMVATKVSAPAPVTAAAAETKAPAPDAQLAGEFPEVNSLDECNNFSRLARDRCREEVYARSKKAAATPQATPKSSPADK